MNRLLACRVCLAYDTRLCSIMDGQFRDIYEKLVEASLVTEDMLPTSACYFCFSLMKKILQFRDRSQKANQIMQHMISSGLEPSLSSLDLLVKDQTGISWTLGISDIDTTTTTSGEAEFKVKIESVKSEMDIDGMSHRNEAGKAEFKVKIESVMSEMDIDGLSDWNEGAAPPEKWKFEKNEAENELVNIQTPFIKTEKDEETRENKEGKKKILYIKEVEMTTSNIISENQNQNAFNKNETVTPSKDILTCDLCKNEYQCKILLESHMKKSHVMEFTRKDSITSDLNVANECSKEQPFKCDKCEKSFFTSGHLTRHLRVHTKERLFKCDMCGKCFTQNSNLTAHLRVHNKEKPFKCDLCEKCFTERSSLTTHLRVHTKEKPFKCDLCGKCFTRSNSLTKHLRVHTKEKPYKCDVCEKGFTQNSNLTAHLRVHTKEKPFKCDICGKRFTESNSLTKHIRGHTKEPFKCDICGKCFTRSNNLTIHLRGHTNEKPFECDIFMKEMFYSTK